MTTVAAAPGAAARPTSLRPWWRRQMPVYSPVSWSAVWAGARAAASSAAAARAERAVLALLDECYAPRETLLTDSGTTALTAAIAAVVRDRPGAPVALPAFACYDLATAADGAAVPVLLYDVDPHTLAPDLASLRAALRRGAAAVVVAHLYGYPVDLSEVTRLAAEAGAHVIEDAAQAHGAMLGGRPAGTQAGLAVLSFGRGKGWTGGGGGALLAFDDAGVRALAQARGLLGMAHRGTREMVALTAQLLLGRPTTYALPAALPLLRLGQTVYRAPRPLHGPAAAACAALAANWPLVDKEIATRRRNAERLLVALHGRPGFEAMRAAAHARPGYLRLPVLASPAVRRAAAERPAARLGISPAYPRALCDLQRFEDRCVNRDAPFPGSRLLAARLCTLPTHSRLSGPDLARVVSWIQSMERRS